MDLKITQEKVLEAAAKCSNAKRILETLFPECFAADSNIIFSKDCIEIDGTPAITREYAYGLPTFKGRSLHLESNFSWELHKDELGYALVFKKRY